MLRLKLFAGFTRGFNVVGYDLPALGPGKLRMMPNLPYFRRHYYLERDTITILFSIPLLMSFVKNRRGNMTNLLPLFSALVTQYNLSHSVKITNL
jgi:hypothetical protein